MMVDVCTDCVVMMVTGKWYHDKVCRQQFFGKTKTLRGPFRELVVSVLMVLVLMVDGVCPPAGVLVVSQLCFGGRWRLGGTLAACLQVLTVFGDVLSLAHVFVVFWQCSGGVSVVFR